MVSHYAAFLSYSHSADRELAVAVQRALQRIGKPWYRAPRIKIFRDEASLSANPGLWSSIEQSLAQSDYFLLLASPDAARSQWVAKEIQWWRTNRPHENLLIVVTDGQIAWDAEARDFDWERTTCLSPEIKGLQREEPLYVDLRWARRQHRARLRNPRFRDAMLMLLAPIYGRPKDELDSEDIRQQRRFRFAAISAGLLIGVLGLAASYGVWRAERNLLEAEKSRLEAEQNRSLARRNHFESQSRKLAAASLAAINEGEGMDRAILLGVLAWRIARTPEAESALKSIQSASADVARILGQHTAAINSIAFSGDSSVFATAAHDGSIALWRVNDWAPTGIVLSGGLRSIEHRLGGSISLDQTGSTILAAGEVPNPAEDNTRKQLILWDVKSRTYRILNNQVPGKAEIFIEILSPNGKLIVMQMNNHNSTSRYEIGPNGKRVKMFVPDSDLVIWDTTAGSMLGQIHATEVRAARFVDNEHLMFLSYRQPDYVVGLPDYVFRVGLWDVAAKTARLGPYIANYDPRDFTDFRANFNGNGSKLWTWNDKDVGIWAVRDDLSVAPLPRPAQLPKEPKVQDVVFDQQGTRVAIITEYRLLVWDLSQARVLKLIRPPKDGGFSSGYDAVALSPDGRWLALMDADKVMIWDLNATDSQDTALSLGARCSLDEADCILRLCKKVSRKIDETMLRDLVGADSYDEFSKQLGGSASCSAN
jgi:WD40 repeat protein